MNLEKLARTVGIVAAAALLAAALQGCGSGGDNGSAVSQAVYDALQADYARTAAERDAAQAARQTAEAAARDAEAARAKAEGAAADAREAQGAAETLRDAAVAAQAAAEAARTTAEAARKTAEATARDAEAARAKAEGERHVANVDKAVAEQAQADAEAAQKTAEQAQADAEAAQKTAEQAQAAAEAAQKAAEAARTTAETERDVANIAKMTAEAAAKAAQEAQTTAEAERDAAQAAQAKAETERAAAVALLNKQTAAEAAQRARVDAAAIQKSADDLAQLPSALAPEGVVIRPASTAKTVPGFQGSDPGRGDTDGDGVLDDGESWARLTVWHSGPTVHYTAASGTGSARQTHFRLSTEAGPVLTSLRKQTDVPGGHTRHVYLVTDIEPPRKDLFRDNVPTGVSFTIDGVGAGYHAATQRTRYALVKADNTANTDVINVATTTAITLDPPAVLTPTAAISSRAVADGLGIPGTYAHAPGTYFCNGGNNGDCTLALNADGELTMQADAAWLFVPDGLITVTDKDYLIYGAWLLKPDSQVGTAYAAALSAGNDLFAAGNIAGLSGKAAYKGAAAGFFAERHIGTDTAVSGTFSATAELAADFATATTGGTVSGTVRDFIRSDGVSVDWLVMLGQVTLPTQNTADGGFAAGDTSGFASGAVWAGEWGVQLVGDGIAAAQHPSGVIGTFGAQHGAPVRLTDTTDPAAADAGFAAVIGGFGARKQ